MTVMKVEGLCVLLAGRVIGELTRGPGRRLAFHYAQAWREAAEGFPLSLSMPLAAASHPHRSVNPFLWGLLPENHLVLDHWARWFQVSAGDPFALLAAVGEDCPGAVQFASRERAAAMLASKKSEVVWLDEAQIGGRMRQLRADQGAWRSRSDTGQFSLAGAQPKTALFHDGRRFGVPAGRTPTTHILKPALPDFDGHAQNEHLCLALARTFGLPAARSSIQRFDGEVAIVVERYDRLRAGTQWVRVHQEDACQALSVMPTTKYQSEGGPGAKQVIDLLRDYSSRPLQDVETFTDALIFNWLIGGTDAHAKNYSILLGAGGQVRLAPLYDVASAYAYPRFDPRKLKLAMKIGGTYRIHEIDRRRWQKLAREAQLDDDALIGRARGMAAALPDAFAGLRRQAARHGLKHAALDRMQRALVQQVAACASRLR